MGLSKSKNIRFGILNNIQPDHTSEYDIKIALSRTKSCFWTYSDETIFYDFYTSDFSGSK